MKILRWIVAIPFVVLVLYVLARFAFCRPSYSVVKTATPMVEKIADYIVAYGIPESLEDIPDLPHELNECKRKIVYEKEVELRDIKVNSKEEADWATHEEECKFIYKDKRYDVKIWFVEHYKFPKSIHGDLDIEQHKTGVGTAFEYRNEKLISIGIGSSFDSRSGFCRKFRQ